MNARSMKVYVAMLALLIAIPVGAASTKKFDVKPGELIEVDLNTGGAIVIHGGDTNEVVVNADVSGRDSGEVNVVSKRTSKGVKVETSFLERLRHPSTRVRVELTVPRRFDVDVETTGGTIEIRHVEGEIRGRTMGGGLTLSDLKGDLSLLTMGGSIEVTDSDVDGKVKTMGGKIIFRNVVGDLDGHSMGGNVEFDNVVRRDGRSTGKVVTITTMGGSIEVANAPAGAQLKTMGGDIEVGSAANFVKVTTMGGDITVRKLDGWIEGTTMGGDIVVTMVGDPKSGKRDIDLDSKGGEIVVTVPDGLDMEFDIELAYTRNSSRDYEIRSDFPMTRTMSDDWAYDHGTARKFIYGKGKVGSGKNRIHITTINGNVTILKGK